MAAKKVRCICGTIFDPAKQPACPSCGEPYKPSPATPPPAEPAPIEPQKMEPLRPVPPAVSPLAGIQRTMDAATHSWRGVPAELRKKIVFGACAALGLLLILLALPDRESNPKESIGGNDPRLPEPAPSISPAPQGNPREWIVESSGTAGGQDLAEVVAKAAAGDTITLRPGIHRGGFAIDRPLTITGSPDAPNQTVIQTDNEPAIDVRAQGFVLSNVLLTAGDRASAAMTLSSGASADLTNCHIQASAQAALVVNRSATLKASKTLFSAPSGTALRIESQAKGRLEECTVSDSRDGISIAAGAEVDGAGCTFQGIAIQGAKAAIATATGKGARLALTGSRFTANGGGINAVDGAALSVADSIFQGNGAIGGGNDAPGLIFVGGNATGSVTGSTFEQNGYGLAASGGGNLDIERCALVSNSSYAPGYGQSVPLNIVPVSASGAGTRVALRQSAIVRPGSHAVLAVSGAAVVIEDSEISDCQAVAVLVGDRSGPPARAQITRSFLRHSGATALWVRAGSSAVLDASEFTENGTGILTTDAGTRVTLKNCVVSGNRDYGLHAHTGSEITATAATLDDNARGAQSGLQNKSSARATLILNQCTIRDSRLFALGASAQSVLTANDCTFENNADLLHRERTAVVNGVKESETASRDEDSSHASRRSSTRDRSDSSYTPRRSSDSESFRGAVERMRRSFRRHFP
jgi:hypothetical protein